MAPEWEAAMEDIQVVIAVGDVMSTVCPVIVLLQVEARCESASVVCETSAAVREQKWTWAPSLRLESRWVRRCLA